MLGNIVLDDVFIVYAVRYEKRESVVRPISFKLLNPMYPEAVSDLEAEDEEWGWYAWLNG